MVTSLSALVKEWFESNHDYQKYLQNAINYQNHRDKQGYLREKERAEKVRRLGFICIKRIKELAPDCNLDIFALKHWIRTHHEDTRVNEPWCD